jgi:hypothetical protein
MKILELADRSIMTGTRRIVYGILMAAVLSGCSIAPYKVVICKVTAVSPVTSSNIAAVITGTTLNYPVQFLPWERTFDVSLHGPISLTADTGSAITGSVTVTIVVDGAVVATSTATAAGTPATASASGSL